MKDDRFLVHSTLPTSSIHSSRVLANAGCWNLGRRRTTSRRSTRGFSVPARCHSAAVSLSQTIEREVTVATKRTNSSRAKASTARASTLPAPGGGVIVHGTGKPDRQVLKELRPAVKRAERTAASLREVLQDRR